MLRSGGGGLALLGAEIPDSGNRETEIPRDRSRSSNSGPRRGPGVLTQPMWGLNLTPYAEPTVTDAQSGESHPIFTPIWAEARTWVLPFVNDLV